MTANTGRADLDQLVRIKNLMPEEPHFHVRGRDPLAGDTVRAWASMAKAAGVPDAVVEQALVQADTLDAWPHKRLPDADHLPEAQRLQLEYQHSRRAWYARDARRSEAIVLAERRGWDAAMAKVRAERAA